MSDPSQVFRDNPKKHDTLKILWPELYEALASGLAADAPQEPRVYYCTKGSCTLKGMPRKHAVGRLDRWGPTACRDCLSRFPGRAWPLDLREHRNPGAGR